MKEELKQFNIDINDIKESNNLIDNIHEAIHQMSLTTMKDRFEVILNNNLIEFKEKTTNYRTIFGCRISYDNLPKDISFIVKPDEKPSYEQLEEENQQLKKQKDDVVEYIKNNTYFEDNIVKTMVFGDFSKDLLRMLGEIDVED